jgi:hypothetical protein
VIDFEQRNVLESQVYGQAFERVQNLVLPDREREFEEGRNAAGEARPHHKQFLERWWKLSWDRANMLKAFGKLSGRFIGSSRNYNGSDLRVHFYLDPAGGPYPVLCT